ncbi:MAG TPA: HD domain-containing phosphohydrolase [Candidatus Limnocylindria bacterium]|nr:HD domain-containing phosphohydrolase [Candidatus Limnocylindria bacterium]
MTPPLRLADLLASVSLLSDLGFALPAEESMRSAVIATALARRLGLDEPTVSDALYTALIQHLGCTGFAHEASAVYGDEMLLNAAVARVDTNDIGDVVNTLIRTTTRGRGPVDWVRVVLATIVGGDRFGRMFATARCEVDRETARRLGLPGSVRRALHESAEAWNGRGGVQGLRGDDISIAARIAAVSATVARFDAIGGPAAAAEVARRRAGGELDPAVCAAFSDHAAQILAEAHAGDPRDALLAAEPAPARVVAEADLPVVAGAIGDVADLKSTYTLGHAAGVARLADAAADTIGLGLEARWRLRIASLLHDVGRVGISTATWDRRGALSAADREQVRLHPYHSERILARSAALEPMAIIAGMHHERLDGSGYHRGSRAREIGTEARILAAADALQAMTQDRPHRPAHGPDEAAEALREEARAGRLDAEAVAAVIGAAGLTARGPVRGAAPAGLSDREVEVLRLVARGHSNREIADRLVVSPRTAEHHVQHIYAKIGVSSRAAAALFAMEHGLIG